MPMQVHDPLTEGFPQPLFPLGCKWDTPRQRWTDVYPVGVPPGLDYARVRTEQVLELAAESFPNRLAIAFFRSEWTYAELLGRVRRAVVGLKSMGVGPGDRVLFVLPNCPEFIVAWFATHWLGAQVVHGSPLNSPSELSRMAKMTRPKVAIVLDVRMSACEEMVNEQQIPTLLVVSLAPHLPAHLRAAYKLKILLSGRRRFDPRTQIRKFADIEKVASVVVPPPASDDPDETAVLQPTGGTTGGSKLAILTHSNLLCNVAQGYTFLGKPPGTVTVLAVLPFFHIYGATAVMLGSIAGAASLILQPRFDPPRVLDAIDKYKPTMAPMVPFMFAAVTEEMAKHNRRLDCLEICCSGASALDSKIRADFEARTGARIVEGYGLSEASPLLISNCPRVNRPGTIGVPVPDTEVRLVDLETGTKDVAIGEVGELIARGPQIMQGYLDNPKETAIALRDGWLYTGDLATMDADGFFKIVDRKKDMIISGGLNIYPSEIEPVITAFPGVSQCAVVGETDPKWGEKVVAYVVPQKGAEVDIDGLRDRCREMLAHYKVPRDFRICESLPVSFLGKVRRVALRETGAKEEPKES
jgi:long-chain acyl-CoA synthetase